MRIEVTYSINVEVSLRTLITSTLGVREGIGGEKYLGFPLDAGRKEVYL